ncbi:hypothetical protein CI610_01364 [invertebrate metagenome]|uniref:Uncharacterized protein n=1 Tax=invertebrate metagenome TaxID=1711999 RepID=A0A2H9T8U9_9ZZZZ
MQTNQIIALLSEVFNNNFFIVAVGLGLIKLWSCWMQCKKISFKFESKRTEIEINFTRK